NTLMINSLGMVEHWRLIFKCVEGFEATAKKMKSMKADFHGLDRVQVEELIKAMADDTVRRFRLKQFFVNEYYPAIIHASGKMVILDKTIDALIKRDIFKDLDRNIVKAVVKTLPEWFAYTD
ncbi:MAG: hypothetical protein J7M06_05705, partial [Proteobacteria bacterium]|nr:hypothetical protein [Pseudomonadota bacterium]